MKREAAIIGDNTTSNLPTLQAAVARACRMEPFAPRMVANDNSR